MGWIERTNQLGKQDIELVVSVPPELLRQKLLGKVERKLDKQLEKAALCWSSQLILVYQWFSGDFVTKNPPFHGDKHDGDILDLLSW